MKELNEFYTHLFDLFSHIKEFKDIHDLALDIERKGVRNLKKLVKQRTKKMSEIKKKVSLLETKERKLIQKVDKIKKLVAEPHTIFFPHQRYKKKK